MRFLLAFAISSLLAPALAVPAGTTSDTAAAAVANSDSNSHSQCFSLGGRCGPSGKCCDSRDFNDSGYCHRRPWNLCASDNDCSTGYVCSGFKCVAKADCTGKGPLCVNNQCCRAGYTCTNNQCVVDCTGKGQLCLNRCCDSGENCVLGACIAPTIICNIWPLTGPACSGKCCKVGQACNSGTCGADCSKSGPACGSKCCNTGETCVDGTCTVPCPNGCPTGQKCVNAACACTDSSTSLCGSNCCKAGETCVDGTCTVPCPNGCPTGQQCVNGACACTDSSALLCGSNCCPAGQTCNGGVCGCASGGLCGGTCCSNTQSCQSNSCVENPTCAATNDLSGAFSCYNNNALDDTRCCDYPNAMCANFVFYVTCQACTAAGGDCTSNDDCCHGLRGDQKATCYNGKCAACTSTCGVSCCPSGSYCNSEGSNCCPALETVGCFDANGNLDQSKCNSGYTCVSTPNDENGCPQSACEADGE